MKHRTRLPSVMRPVSAAQLVTDSSFNLGKTNVLLPSSNTFGNTVEFVNPGPGNVSSNASFPEQRLVRADSADLYPDKNPWDGNIWVLSGGIAQSGNQDAANNDSSAIRLRILFGSGGTMLTAIVTASPQFVINIPSNTIDVSVFVPPSFPNNALQPGVYRVSAILHRGTQVSTSAARLQTLPQDQVPGIPSIIVPLFAKRVQTLGASISPIYGAGVSMTFDTAAAATLSYTGPELLALKNAGTKIEIPAGVTSVSFTGFGFTIPPLSWDIEP